MIARNELAAADYYITRKAYVASIRRANYVLENIPGSSENLRALKILLVSYEALGYSELYEDTKKVIAMNYIDSEEPKEESSWFWNSLQKIKPE
jgi:outer membrane protein assembly factor BamD